LVHQPLALDPGLDPIQAQTFRETERAALAVAAHVVVTSQATGRIVISDYDIPSCRVTVVRTAAQLDADIAPYGLGNRVAVLGAVPPEGITNLYLASDVFVRPTTSPRWQRRCAGLSVIMLSEGALP
jgi:hypothetical protein